MKIQIN